MAEQTPQPETPQPETPEIKTEPSEVTSDLPSQPQSNPPAPPQPSIAQQARAQAQVILARERAKKKKILTGSLVAVCVTAIACVGIFLSLNPIDTGSGDQCRHTTVIDAGKAATCTEDGLTEGKHCSICGEVFVQQTTIRATGHTPKAAVRENEIPATCTQEGSYDEVFYCDACGKKLGSMHQTAERLAHDYVNGFCTVCG